jgi:hypothetical protein
MLSKDSCGEDLVNLLFSDIAYFLTWQPQTTVQTALTNIISCILMIFKNEI